MAEREEKRNRRKKREETIQSYETYTYTGPSTAIVIFGTYFASLWRHKSGISLKLTFRARQAQK